MIVMKLKLKYLLTGKPKFGGKKRQGGNSGGIGRRAIAAKRPRVVSQRTSPEQYQNWYRAMNPTKRA